MAEEPSPEEQPPEAPQDPHQEAAQEPVEEPVQEPLSEANAESAAEPSPEPEQEAAVQPTPQSSPESTPGDFWYYMKPNQQETVGPVHADELKHLYVTGKISKNTLVWTEGMANWEEIGHVVALQKTEKVKLNISTPGSPKPGSAGEGSSGS